MVGLHAAFTCEPDTISAAAEMADPARVSVSTCTWPRVLPIRGRSCAGTPRDDWWLVHGVHLPTDHGLRGTIVHNPRSNMNNAVGYGAPVRFANPVALGTDGIGADMLDEFRVAFVRAREHDVTTTPDVVWEWLQTGYRLFPEALDDRVVWDYAPMDPWRLAYSPGTTPISVEIDGEVVFENGTTTMVDEAEIRAKAAEAAQRLFRVLADDGR